MLTLDKNGSSIALAWGISCAIADNDYAVYEGPLGGQFTDHAAVGCSTGGATTLGFEPAAGNRYYLVVPTNGTFEGSYGSASDGSPRGQGVPACAPMDAIDCG